MSQAVEFSIENEDASLIVVSRRNGRVVGQSQAARSLLGSAEEVDSANNLLCWSLMRRAASNGEDLPCTENCVSDRLSLDTPVEPRSISLHGGRFELRCDPVGDQIVTTLHPLTDPEPIHDARLTPREVEVLQLLADGLDGTEIAKALEICPGTVRTHVEHMRESLGCRTRAGLVAKGYRLRYLD